MFISMSSVLHTLSVNSIRPVTKSVALAVVGAQLLYVGNKYLSFGTWLAVIAS